MKKAPVLTTLLSVLLTSCLFGSTEKDEPKTRLKNLLSDQNISYEKISCKNNSCNLFNLHGSQDLNKTVSLEKVKIGDIKGFFSLFDAFKNNAYAKKDLHTSLKVNNLSTTLQNAKLDNFKGDLVCEAKSDSCAIKNLSLFFQEDKIFSYDLTTKSVTLKGVSELNKATRYSYKESNTSAVFSNIVLTFSDIKTTQNIITKEKATSLKAIDNVVLTCDKLLLGNEEEIFYEGSAKWNGVFDDTSYSYYMEGKVFPHYTNTNNSSIYALSLKVNKPLDYLIYSSYKNAFLALGDEEEIREKVNAQFTHNNTSELLTQEQIKAYKDTTWYIQAKQFYFMFQGTLEAILGAKNTQALTEYLFNDKKSLSIVLKNSDKKTFAELGEIIQKDMLTYQQNGQLLSSGLSKAISIEIK